MWIFFGRFDFFRFILRSKNARERKSQLAKEYNNINVYKDPMDSKFDYVRLPTKPNYYIISNAVTLIKCVSDDRKFEKF